MKHILVLYITFLSYAAKAQIPTDSLKGHYTFNATLNDFSGEGNNIVSGSGTFVNDRFGNINEAFYLNGISDSLTLPIAEFSPIVGDFTLSFWYKTNSPTIMNCFSSKQSATDTTNNFEIQLNSHNSYYLQYNKQSFYSTFVYWNGSGVSFDAVAEGAPGGFTNGEWCNFTITRQADTFRIYRNHVLYTLSEDNLFSGTLGDAVDLIFSASPYRFKGAIDDMRLYNRSLNQGEIDFLWFENKPFSFTTVKPNDAFVQGSNVLVFWEYDTSQVSDSILVEYRLNGGSWIPAVHTNFAYECYTYVNMTYAPGTTVEVRVSDFTNPTLTQSSGVFSVSEYDWVEVSSALPFNAKDGSGLVSFNNKMWLLGGWDPPYHPPMNTHSEVWSSSDGVNWTFETTAPWPARHCSAWLTSDSTMWVIGGDPQSGCLTDVWKSTDGINWTQTNTAIPGFVARNNPNYAFANGQLFVYGGEQCSGDPLNEVWSSIDGITWNQLPNAPWAGRGMQVNSCVDGSGQIWMLGGSSEGTRRSFNEVWKTTDGITWTLVNESAPWRGRYWHTVAWFDNKMWLMGGMATASEVNDVWYSDDGINWHEFKSTTGNVPANTRHAQSTTVYDNALWYMCGISTNNAWKIINTTTLSMNESAETNNSTVKIFPNPLSQTTNISLSLAANANVQINIYNSLGQFISNPINSNFLMGNHSLTINANNLQNGIYIYEVMIENRNLITGRMVVSK